MRASRLMIQSDAESISMKWTKPLAICAAVLVGGSLSATEPDRPDLAVARLAPDALCVGADNEIVVTLENLGGAPAEADFDLILTVQLPGRPPTTLRSTPGAIRPGGRIEIRFVRVEITAPAEVLLRAEADPDRLVDEVNRRNNTAAALVPATGDCGRRSKPTGRAAETDAREPAPAPLMFI